MLLEASEFGISNRVHGFVRFGVESTGVWCCEERFLGEKNVPKSNDEQHKNERSNKMTHTKQ